MLLTDEHKLKLLDLAEDWHLSPAGARASFRWDRLVNYVQQLVDEGSDVEDYSPGPLDFARMSTAGHGDPHDR